MVVFVEKLCRALFVLLTFYLLTRPKYCRKNSQIVKIRFYAVKTQFGVNRLAKRVSMACEPGEVALI